MAWIKFEKDLLTDPRVLRMARIIGSIWKITDEGDGTFICNGQALPAVTLVCGALVRLWCLADTHVDENDTMPLGFDEIDEYVGIPGFCLQMPPEWLQRVEEHRVKLPNFHAHNGTEAKRKAVTQKRVAAFRVRSGNALPHRNGRALPDQDQDQDQDLKNSSNGSRKNGAHHASVDDSPVVQTLPLRDGSEYPVRQSLVAELEPLYPAVDVPATLKEMKGWLVLNTERRKTRAGIRRFIGNWLQSEQAKHGG